MTKGLGPRLVPKSAIFSVGKWWTGDDFVTWVMMGVVLLEKRKVKLKLPLLAVAVLSKRKEKRKKT